MNQIKSGNNLPYFNQKMDWHGFCNVRCEASQLEAGCQEPGKCWLCSANPEE